MENSHSETRLILSLSLQDIDNLAKDLKPRQRMFRFFSLLRHAAETDGTQTKRSIDYSVRTGQVGASHSELGKEWDCNRSTVTRFLKETCQRMELQPQYSHPFPEGTGGRRTRQSQHG